MVNFGKPLGVAPIEKVSGSTLDKTPTDEDDLFNRTKEADKDMQTMIKLSKESGESASYFHNKKMQANAERKEMAARNETRKKLGYESVFQEKLNEAIKNNSETK